MPNTKIPSKAKVKRRPRAKKPITESASPPEPHLQSRGLVPSRSLIDDIKAMMGVFHEAGTYKTTTPEVAVVKVLKGLELGLHAQQSLTHIWLAEQNDGSMRPVADSAELFRALIQKAGGSVVPIEMTPQRCVVRCTRGSITQDFAYTIQEAESQGLVRPGNAYTTMPTDMLFARATTRAGRAMFADIIGGLSYTAEEMGGAVQPAAPTTPPVAEVSPSKAPETPAATHGSAEAAVPEGQTPPTPPQPPAQHQRPWVPNAGDAADLPEIEGRKAVLIVQVQDGTGVQTLPTCGITTAQLMAIKALLQRHTGIRPVYDAWMDSIKHQKATSLTEQEAGMLIARLQAQAPENEQAPPQQATPLPPETPPAAETPPATAAVRVNTWETAKAKFDALVARLGLNQAEIELVMSHTKKVKSMQEFDAAMIEQATMDLEHAAVGQRSALEEAMTTAREIIAGQSPDLPGGPY